MRDSYRIVNPPVVMYSNPQLNTGIVYGCGFIASTIREGIFDGFFEVFWIFLKNEHALTRTVWCRENQALCNLII